MEIIKKDIKLCDIVIEKVIDNVFVLDMVFGGLINIVFYMFVFVNEVGVEYFLECINEVVECVLYLLKLVLVLDVFIEDLYEVGGVLVVFNELLKKEGVFYFDVLIVIGWIFGEIIVSYEVKDYDVIYLFDNLFIEKGGLVVLFGNLVLDGVIIKIGGVQDGIIRYEGFVVVFDLQDVVFEGIINCRVKEGDVVIICYEGLKGGLGMLEMFVLIFQIVGMGFGLKVVFIIDGCFLGVFCGFLIGYVLFEVVEGGLFVFVENGDYVIVDIEKWILDV